jgi:hypothetical protein
VFGGSTLHPIHQVQTSPGTFALLSPMGLEHNGWVFALSQDMKYTEITFSLLWHLMGIKACLE